MNRVGLWEMDKGEVKADSLISPMHYTDDYNNGRDKVVDPSYTFFAEIE